MKAALLFGVNDLRHVSVAPPQLTADDVLVRVHACGVCPTDLRKFRTGDGGTLNLPMNLGHEWVGTVVGVGRNVRDFATGMRVVGDTYNGYAEYALLSAQDRARSFPFGPLKIPDTVCDEELTFVEPLADCLHALCDQAQLTPGQTVVVCGAGQMGLQLVAVAKWLGAHVLVSEPQELRRALAREWGADHVLDPNQQEVIRAVRALTEGRGADVVILAIGIPSLVNDALAMVRARGRVVLFAGFARPAKVEIDPNRLHYDEIVLTGSEWIGAPPHHQPLWYQQAVDLIAQKIIPVDKLITHRFTLEEIAHAFAKAADPRALKVIVQMNYAEH